MKEENNIVETTAQTIISYNLDPVMDFAEIEIDKLLDESLFQDLPLVKTVYGVAKTGFAIREKHMLKKTLVFINQLNTNGLSSENYQKYKERLKRSDKVAFKELEHALIIIDRYIEIKKNIILANLYFNYINQKISWEQFKELSIIVDNIFLEDVDELENIYSKQAMTMNDIKNKTSFRRLQVQNLVESIETTLRMPDGSLSMYYNENDYRITELGVVLYKFGLNKE